MSIRTLASALVALAALFLVALAPTGAAAHAGHVHAHVKAETAATSGATQDRNNFRVVEVRSHVAPIHDHGAGMDCDRGCCNAGHCSGCGTVLAPSTWTSPRAASRIRLSNPDASALAGLASGGPPRPPKFFV